MKLSVAFYTGTGHIIDKLIRWWTKSRYSHCELVLCNGQVMFSADAWTNSIRYTNEFNPNNWEFIDFEISKEREDALILWCNDQAYKKYDWLGVLGFVVPWFKQDSNRWFCSEICGAALKRAGLLPVSAQTSRLSPQGLWNVLVNKG